ncbi:hypothetical protein BD779DRAFT_1508427 [Infundibulicybe gibba]|nr:hypothetical protein BD779DRAFT_1508427 [Infundibulicybe gibba]
MEKLPWIWAATLGLHMSSTPPAPTPPLTKATAIVPKRSILDRLILEPRTWAITKWGYWALVAAETSVVLASTTPHLEISKTILRIFFRNGNLDKLRLSPALSLGVGLTLIGSLLRVYCFRSMGRFFIFERRIANDHKLVTSGPYGVVRHPSYTAFLFEFPGIVLLHMSQGSLLKEGGFLDTQTGMGVVVAWLTLRFAASVLLMRTTPLEDAALRGKFGEEWDKWAQRVPYRLIPGIF